MKNIQAFIVIAILALVLSLGCTQTNVSDNNIPNIPNVNVPDITQPNANSAPLEITVSKAENVTFDYVQSSGQSSANTLEYAMSGPKLTLN